VGLDDTSENVRIAVIGAGPGGICTGYRLLRRGTTDFVILEKGSGPGGTWFHNRYPGVECDIKSHLYSFSFEPNAEWSRPYAGDAEIRSYLERCVDKFGLQKHLRYGAEVRAAYWDDDAARWTLELADGRRLVAEIVVSAMGMFNEPHVPVIEGLDAFAGTHFHTSRWPRDHDLAGERVAVIGTAASAIQLVPEVAKVAAQLFVFQRSAQWVTAPKEDQPYTDAEIERLRHDPAALAALRQELFDFLDSRILFSDPTAVDGATASALRALEAVGDPEVRTKLTPTVPYGCQRPLSSNTYYTTYNRPNVELVTDPIARITPEGVVTEAGAERAVGTIIFATGFQTTKFLAAIDVTGRNGVRLADEWADGPQAYLGITTAGFPNLFMLYGPNTNNGSIIFMIECQVDYIMRKLELLETDHLAWVDVRRDAQQRYNEELQHALDNVGPWQVVGCSNYYRGPTGRIVTQWPKTMLDYQRATSRPDHDAFETARR
jgi:cyclohexanone monooxygenase